MKPAEQPRQALQYKLVMALARPAKILLVRDASGKHALPHLFVPMGCRPVETLQRLAKAHWGCDLLLLEGTFETSDGARVRVARCLTDRWNEPLAPATLDQVSPAELDEFQIATIQTLICEDSSLRPFSRSGWMDDVEVWFQQQTGKRLGLRSEIRQYHADRGHALIRLSADDGSLYWFKAAGQRVRYEFEVVRILAQHAPTTIPNCVGFHDRWYAWLSEDAGTCLSENTAVEGIEQAVRQMGAFQRRTLDVEGLTANPQLPHRSEKELRKSASALFAYFEEALARGEESRSPRIEIARLRRLFQRSCAALEAIRLPRALCHGDVHPGNILWDGSACRFVDWENAHVGDPFIEFEHVALLLRSADDHRDNWRLRLIFGNAWRDLLTPEEVHAAFAAVPIVAAAAALYGDGCWLNSSLRHEPSRMNYARKVIRWMERMAFGVRSDEVPSLRRTDLATVVAEFFRSIRSAMEFAGLVLQAWYLLSVMGSVMQRRGASGVHDAVRREVVSAGTQARHWSTEEMSQAIDIACVLRLSWVLCLQRSSALVALCRRHGQSVEMVIGGKMYPLGLHAWVQQEGHVVNDGSHVLQLYQVLERC